MKALLFPALVVALHSYAFAIPAHAGNSSCPETIRESFVPSLLKRLKNLDIPNFGPINPRTIRVRVGGSNGNFSVGVTTATGQSGGGMFLTTESLVENLDESGPLEGLVVDVHLKPHFEGSGLGTLIYLIAGLKMEEKSFKVHSSFEHNEKAEGLWIRLQAAGLADRKEGMYLGKKVHVYELNLSKLSQDDRNRLLEFVDVPRN